MSADPTGKTVETIVEAVQRKKDSEGDRLVLPRFQRTIVWSRSKQIDLVDSVHHGYPVGALLWWKAPSPEDSKGTRYVLVDGLQRTMALKSYLDEPLAYKKFDLLPAEVQKALSQPIVQVIGGALDQGAFARGIDEWLAETKRCEMGEGFEADTLLDSLQQALALDKWPVQVTRRDVNRALDLLRRWIERVKGAVIPVIIWDGGQEDLPEVFRRLNRTAQKLTAYDLLAAQWYETAVRLKDKALQDEVEAKYESLAGEDMTVIDTRRFDDLPDPDSLYNLYEYLVGLGRWQAKKRPYLFKPPHEDEFDNPGWIFSAATVSHGLRIGDMEALPERFAHERDKRVIDPTTFQEAFSRSVTLVWESLSPFLGVNLNRKTDTPVDREHAELQMVSMVCAVLLSCWERDAEGKWSRRTEASANEKTLRRTLPQHYLLDIIEGEWQGAGDTKAFNRVWEESQGNPTPSRHFLEEVDRQVLDAALDRWFEREGIQRAQKERQLVRSIEKMMLRFVYSQVLLVAQDRGQPFDIEHLFPVKRLVDLARADTLTPGWPISSVANLALLDVSLNRKKRALTLSEAIATEHNTATRHKKRRRLEQLILCRVSEVNIPANFTRQKYITFLRARWTTLKNYVLAGLYRDAD